MENNLQSPLPKLKIRQIEFRTHVHATETIEKVKKSFSNIIPTDVLQKELQVNNCKGTFGQRITDILIVLKVQKSIKECMSVLKNQIGELDKELLKESFENRLDEKFKFYFRIDKQQLAQGEIELAKTNDVIQIIIAVQNKSSNRMTRDHIRKYFIDLGLICN